MKRPPAIVNVMVVLVGALVLALSLDASLPAEGRVWPGQPPPLAPETRYLAFQMFTDRSPLFGSNAPSITQEIADRSDIEAWVQDLVTHVGSVGSGKRKLAFFIGSLTLDHSDDQLRRLIADAFDVAVGLKEA